VAIAITIYIGMYLFALTAISDFADTHIQGSMLEKSRNIYAICDNALNEILRSGLMHDEKEIAIKKALTIGAIEDYMRENKLVGLITDSAGKTLLATDNISLTDFPIAQNNAVSPVEYQGQLYYAHSTDFTPWDWHILFMSDARIYTALLNEVRLAYITTGGIFLISVFLLLCYLNKTIKNPINKIIQPLKEHTQPEYKGISEFEFISNSIKDMMLEKERLMEQVIEEQKLKGIRVLAAGVAHNFNNMLVGVLGYASLVRAKLEDVKKAKTSLNEHSLDEMLKYVTTIETSAQKAGTLARELTELSRKKELEKDFIAQVDINTVVTELKHLLKNTFPKNIEIIANLSTNLPLIKGNASQLEQSILNICINSKDAMPSGGKLSIETSMLNIKRDDPKPQYLKPGSYVVVSISDTGTGMDEETLSHIFEPFFTTKPVDKGTGLGLAAVYSIIKAHNGYITAKSTPNKGTTFIIYLPVSE
jgi:signal transduction histidine kinase